MRRVQERLGRDAPHVEARPPERPAPLDARHLHAELRAFDRGDVASGPAADDDDVLDVAPGVRGEGSEEERVRVRARERRERGEAAGERGEHRAARVRCYARRAGRAVRFLFCREGTRSVSDEFHPPLGINI